MSALDTMRNAKRVGFLFSGSSSRTFFQVGVVETLYDLGLSRCREVRSGASDRRSASP